MPDGSQLPFNLQPEGTFRNATIPPLRAAVIRSAPNRIYNLRWKNGTVFQFQASGLLAFLTAITDPNGNTITLVRGSNPNQLTQVVDPVGRALTLSYDSANRITSITDPIGRTVQYTYNAQGTLATVTDPAGGVTHYAYDSQNNLTQTTDARGIVAAQDVYDQNGRVVRQTAADGGVITFDYTYLNPTAPAVSPVLVTKVTDAVGNVSRYHFSPQGFLLDATDASGQMRIHGRQPGTNLLLSSAGNSSCTACGGGVDQQTYTYDANGNVSSITDALGNTTTFTYEPAFSQLTSVTDAIGHVTTFDYDGRGNLLRVTDANGNTTTYEYDGFGQLTRVTDPLGQQTSVSHDGLGNVIGVTDAAGATTSATYDGVSRPTSATDSLGRTTAVTYDVLDRIAAQTDAQKNTTLYTYDAVGNPLTVTDPRGNMTSVTYDPVGRLATKTTPLGTTETSTYDGNGNVIQFVDRRGQISRFAYDALNRLITETYQDGTTVQRSYDANGRLIQANDSVSGMFTRTYDLNGRLTSSAGPFGAVQYARDALGRVASRTVVGQAPIQYTYDPAGNLLKAATQGAEVDLAYDARDALLRLRRANGVTSTYSYDSIGRLLSFTHANTGGTLSSQRYTYDAAGFRTAVTTSGTQPLVTQAVSNQFDANNRLLQSSATAFTYDGNGNIIAATGPDGTTTYTWDTRNRLESILAPSGQRTALLYDFAGRLISQTDSGPTGNRTRAFVLDDLTNVAFIEDSTGDQISVLGGRLLDQHFAIIHRSGAVEYRLIDGSNSTVATTDHTGNVVDRFVYEPFGQTAAGSSDFPFQFTGRVPVTGGLYSYRNRYYDSALGRFASEDPIGFLGGDDNLYRYVQNDPVDLTDATGLCPCSYLYLDPGEWAMAIRVRGQLGASFDKGGSFGPVLGQRLLGGKNGDVIRTGSNGRAQIQTANGSVATLGPDTCVIFTNDPNLASSNPLNQGSYTGTRNTPKLPLFGPRPYQINTRGGSGAAQG